MTVTARTPPWLVGATTKDRACSPLRHPRHNLKPSLANSAVPSSIRVWALWPGKLTSPATLNEAAFSPRAAVPGLDLPVPSLDLPVPSLDLPVPSLDLKVESR